MSSIVVSGDTSGAITIAAPAVAGTNTLTLPASTGTVALTGAAVTKSQLPTGTILQVVNVAYSTATNTASTSFVTTGLTASITPSFSTSKILVIANVSGIYNANVANAGIALAIFRGSTNIITFAQYTNYISTTATVINCAGTSYLDSPATTSSTAYSVQFYNHGVAATVGVQSNSDTSTITLMEVAA
jgi:hypothetical protein